MTPDGWNHQSFPWPLSMPLPDFGGVAFVDDLHGWVVGHRLSHLSPDVVENRVLMTLFHTGSGGERWEHFDWHDPGKLNDIDVTPTPIPTGLTSAVALGISAKAILDLNWIYSAVF